MLLIWIASEVQDILSCPILDWWGLKGMCLNSVDFSYLVFLGFLGMFSTDLAKVTGSINVSV